MRNIFVPAVAMLVLLQACAQHSTAPHGEFLKVGSQAPQFSARTLDGTQVSLSSYHGKTLLLLFATTWCGPCKGEAADVIRSYRALHSSRVAFLRIDTQEDANTVQAFVTEYGEPYPVALDPTGSIASSGYDMPPAFPIAYVIDPNGIVQGSMLRPYQYANYIHAAERGKTYVVPISPAARAAVNRINPRRFTFKGNEATVVRQVKAAQAAIAAAEAAMPDNADYHALSREERAITAKMIAALQPVARTAAARKLLLSIQLESSEDVPLEAGQAALMAGERRSATYAKALLALDPSDTNTEERLVISLSVLKRYAEALRIAQQYAKRYPGATTYGAVAFIYESNKNTAKQAYWENKVLQTDQRLAPTDANLESVAEQARYLGTLEGQLGNTQRAMQFFQLALATVAKIKVPTRFTQLDIQDAEMGELALRLAGKTHGTAIFLEPWTGAPLPGSTANTIKYRLVVVGTPNTDVQLTAMHYASGWLPSFCSNNLCSPIRRLVSVPGSGTMMLEFQMIPNDPAAPRVSPVTVVASGSGSTTSASLTTRSL